MSKNQHLPLADSKKKTDARVRRTRDALGDALIALMQEKPLLLLTWWLDRGMREPPEEMDQLFHRMVWKGVGAH